MSSIRIPLFIHSRHHVRLDDMKIAIIDSGIDPSHPRLSDYRIDGIAIRRMEDGAYCHTEDYLDDCGHGTAIAGIIHKIIPGVELVAVKLYSDGETADEGLLTAALDWCIGQRDIKIVNVSLGVPNGSGDSQLYGQCERAFLRNVFICASQSNDPGQETYPANFPFVWGVSSGMVKSKFTYRLMEGNLAVNILAKGGTQRVAWTGQTYRITSGNSFATAHFTGILGKLLEENPSVVTYEDTRQMISVHSTADIVPMQYLLREENVHIPEQIPSQEQGRATFHVTSRFDYISRIALFPYCEKEIGTIVRFREECPYPIVRLFDYPRLLRADDVSLESDIPICKEIRDDYFEDFDTLVVGYFLDQPFDSNILYGYELIGKALTNNKNIVTWDRDVYQYVQTKLKEPVYASYAGHVWYPRVDSSSFDRLIQFRYLPVNRAPVLAVVGTSNRQEKITTQLRLKQILRQQGYRSAHISTEPQGLFLGADFLFPYGHKDTIYFDQSLWGKFLLTAVKGLDYYHQPDIILTGIQSSLVPRFKDRRSLTDESALASLHFFCGVSPNAVICAVNPEDTLENIRNVEHAASIFSRAPVLFFVLTPWTREQTGLGAHKQVLNQYKLSPGQMEARRAELEAELGKPVIDIMDPGYDPWIVGEIENAFSK